jgi:TIR domain
VFLSYASADVESAQRICEALRTAGIEVRFDKSELRGIRSVSPTTRAIDESMRE